MYNLLSGHVIVPLGWQMGKGIAESLSTSMNGKQSASPVVGQKPTDKLTSSWVLLFSIPYLGKQSNSS